MSDRPGPVEVRGAVGDERAATSLASLPAAPDMPEPCLICPIAACGYAWCRTAEPVPRELLTAVGGDR